MEVIMKKFFTWTFWLAILGSLIYFYMTSSQMQEYCSICKKRILDLFDHMGCCKQDEAENVKKEEDVE
jgi:hypothetical protein